MTPSVRSPAESDRESALARLRPGDVVQVSRGRYRGPAVMVASANRKAGMRLTVISEDADSLLVTADDVIGPVEALGKVRLPGSFQPKDRQYRREVAKRLARTSLRQAGTRRRQTRPRPEVHPVEFDPDLRHRVSAAAQAERLRSGARRRSALGWKDTTARSAASSTGSSACSSTADT